MRFHCFIIGEMVLTVTVQMFVDLVVFHSFLTDGTVEHFAVDIESVASRRVTFLRADLGGIFGYG